jgi:hypothetical protein
MHFARASRVCTFLALALAVSACVNLSAVRDYSATAGSVVSQTDVAAMWAGAADRLAQLPNQPEERIAKLRAERAQVFKEITKVHALLGDYYLVVTALAADELVKVDTQAQGLADGLAEIDSAFSAADKQAFVSVASLLRLPLDAYRQRELRKFLLQTEQPVDRLLTSLAKLNSIYAQSLQGEREIAEAPYRRFLAEASTPPATKLLLARNLGQISARYDDYLGAVDTYTKSIELVRARHQAMIAATSDTGELLKTAVSQLRQAQSSLREARLAIKQASAQ